MTKQEFVPIFEAFCNARFLKIHENPGSLEIWYQCMKGLTLEEFARAASLVLTVTSEFPTPELFLKVLGKSAPSAGRRAWTKVIDAVATYGTYKTVDFGWRTNVAVRAVGGWIHLGECPSEDLQFKQGKFIEAFTYACDEDDGSPLCGISSGGGVVRIETYKEDYLCLPKMSK